MALTRIVVLHDTAETVPAPPSEEERATAATSVPEVSQTTIIYDDVDTVDLSGLTFSRSKFVPFTTESLNRYLTRKRIVDRRTDLESIIATTGADLTAMTEAERWTWALVSFKAIARACLGLGRIGLGRFSDGAD